MPRKNKDQLTTLETPESGQESPHFASYKESPLPPPEVLEKYELLYEKNGLTKLFLDSINTQTAHRRLRVSIIASSNSALG